MDGYDKLLSTYEKLRKQIASVSKRRLDKLREELSGLDNQIAEIKAKCEAELTKVEAHRSKLEDLIGQEEIRYEIFVKGSKEEAEATQEKEKVRRKRDRPPKVTQLGPYLLNLREKSGFSKAHVARQAGINPLTLKNIESSKNPPSKRSLMSLAEVYGVSFESLQRLEQA